MRRLAATAGLVVAVAGGLFVWVSRGPREGDQAPLFALAGSDGSVHRLADYRHRQAVVLAWFPKAYTRGCTLECRSLATHGDSIMKYDVAFFMASVDPLEDSAAFARAERATFPLLADPAKVTAISYGVLNPLLGVANRWTFYIGRDGSILSIDKEIHPATSAQDIAATLHRLGVPEHH